MTTSALATHLHLIQEKIARCEQKYHRNAGDVALLAVSKTRTVDEIRTLAKLGQIQFGENYAQEAIDKMARITDLALIWHFIGPIQKNKTKLIAENFQWVHSLDREIIATRLNQQRPPGMATLNVCLQVNIDHESSKSGIAPSEVLEFAGFANELTNLKLRGLMAIPSAKNDQAQQEAVFKKMMLLFNKLKQNISSVDTLSMGMSNDFEAAIAHGSTMVRIGTALFGTRHTHYDNQLKICRMITTNRF